MLDIWAGIECTINRVGDVYHDQCKQSRHLERHGDLKLIRELGVKTLRYPFLWETADWDYFDRRAEEMRRLEIVPVAGLLHHGSGPKNTHLLDPEFPRLFADYAGQFAKRYPDIVNYTPINEPLTTARFSGLYGVWYPHGRSDAAFLRALIHQTQATILAMQSIRAVNRHARLIQTEDLGKTSGTERLQYQVEFENSRRWLSMDLLCGRVIPEHPLYRYFLDHGITAEELLWIFSRPTPPDIFGINHYLLSNRFLDDEVAHYPDHLRGGNGIDHYADVGAVDSPRAESIAPSALFVEAWERYHIPIVITEVHASGGRESQLQWFHSILQEAQIATDQGAEINAVTAWSVFGSFDWNSLCTKVDGYYESGVFDLRTGNPKPTAIATYLKSFLAGHESQLHPVLEQNGWWVKRDRANSKKGIRIYGNQTRLDNMIHAVCLQRGLRVLSEFATDVWGIIDLQQAVSYRTIRVREKNASSSGILYLRVVVDIEDEMSDIEMSRAAHHLLDLLIDGENGCLHMSANGNIQRKFLPEAQSISDTQNTIADPITNHLSAHSADRSNRLRHYVFNQKSLSVSS